MGGLLESFFKLIDKKALMLLVILAMTGIIMSIYPAYEGLYNDTGKKLGLIKQWKELGYKDLPVEIMDAVYEQLSKELESNNGRVEATITLLLNKKAPGQFWRKYVYKFLTGGMFYLFVYGSIFIFCLIELEVKEDRKNLWIQNKFVGLIWLFMSVVNAFIPFISPSINYIFMPSCLTLLVAVMSILRNEVKEHIRQKANSSPKV